ncbi:DUF1361 domain-containing protein [Deminuibacter soli]|uniref:DUF1361 domain-containing protein n=1 Tax=Deminuibacter soli TaxID=2291815 RepID=A0A3E1NPP5_9BACT|nr:DUF1361 domain-containing protein [Deminuibacter soli]RFM29901.1 DUF1361 domain-containing protein [Deminuibacter soli]
MARLNLTEKLVLAHVAFTLLLIVLRLHYNTSPAYFFYAWNLVLAIVPVVLAKLLARQARWGWKSAALCGLWLLFYPNTAYLVTDILHFSNRPPVPLWYDLLIVLSAAWNGLLLFMLSLLPVETWLLLHTQLRRFPVLGATGLHVACAYGIYLGRFLRFNSWDVVSDPQHLAHTLFQHVFDPLHNMQAWGFTFLFGLFLALSFYTIKKLPGFQ